MTGTASPPEARISVTTSSAGPELPSLPVHPYSGVIHNHSRPPRRKLKRNTSSYPAPGTRYYGNAPVQRPRQFLELIVHVLLVIKSVSCLCGALLSHAPVSI